MRRMSIALALAATLVLSVASVAVAGGPPANAGSPTCAGATWDNHGDHITTDYANPGEPGGVKGSAAHFHHLPEVGPGASFCLEQAQAESPGFPPGWDTE
jgi:hypothetical protein